MGFGVAAVCILAGLWALFRLAAGGGATHVVPPVAVDPALQGGHAASAPTVSKPSGPPATSPSTEPPRTARELAAWRNELLQALDVAMAACGVDALTSCSTGECAVVVDTSDSARWLRMLRRPGVAVEEMTFALMGAPWGTSSCGRASQAVFERTDNPLCDVAFDEWENGR